MARPGGILAAAAGIRAPMLAGAVPIAVVTVFTGWRHRAAGQRSRDRLAA